MVVYEDNRTLRGRRRGRRRRSPRSCCSTSTAPLVRIGGPDIPAMPFAGPLEHVFMPNAEGIHARMLELAKF